MVVGHYSAAFLIKKMVPSLPLWFLFVAVQFADYIHFALKFFGLEQSKIDPQKVGPLSMDLHFMPFSHSLAAAFGTSLIVYLVTLRFTSNRNSIFIAAAVSSHWVLDFLVHMNDLPILFDDGLKVGLGLWQWPVISFLFEIFFLLVAVFFWGNNQFSYRPLVLVALLSMYQFLFSFVLSPPLSPIIMSLAAIATFSIFAYLAYWAVDHDFGEQIA